MPIAIEIHLTTFLFCFYLSSFFNEFSTAICTIQSHHLFATRMFSRVFYYCGQFQILYSIIFGIAIYMVYNFPCQ